MGKSENAFRTIGEMSEELNVKTHILRYWEEQFPMLNPLKRAGGRRHYRREDVELLKQIHRLLNDEGYTIKGARKFLASGGNTAEQSAEASQTNNSESFDYARLRSIRDRMVAALAQA